MAIISGNKITWLDFQNAGLNAIKASCCNIDSISDVPSYARSDAQAVRVGTGQSTWKRSAHDYTDDYRTTYNYAWNGSPTSGLISVVSTSTVNAEWSAFLSAAGISTRDSKFISAKDLTLATGLFMQFLSYHKKPVYIVGKMYSATSTFMAYKYVTGTVTPKYVISGETDLAQAEITDNDLTNIINQDLQANQLMTFSNNTVPYKSTIVGGGRI